MATNVRGGALFFFRALLALSMWLGFYLLTFGVSLMAFAAFIFLLLNVRGTVVFVPLALSIFSAYTAVKVLFHKDAPRLGREIEITREDEPELFSFVEDVALEMQTRPPTKILLSPEPTAFVYEEGGFLGLASTRCLGLGYPVLRHSNRSDVRAILAHELGHYVGGDTALGALVHRSHAVLVRSLSALSDGHGDHAVVFVARLFLVSILRAYTKVALRVSLAIARLQELEADRHAVRLAGRHAYLRSLERIVHDSQVFRGFLVSEVEPLYATEVWPEDFWAGFDAFAAATRSNISADLAVEERDPYDTHPTFQERVAFARSLPETEVLDDERPAVALLANPETTWQRVEQLMSGKLPRVPWTDAATRRGQTVYELAKAMSAPLRAFLGGRTWSEIAGNGVACVATEGPYRIVVAAHPGMRQVNAAQWRVLAPGIFGDAFGAIVAMSLVEDRGGAFAHVFGDSLKVVVQGESFCPTTLARDAILSSDGLARLRSVLTRAEAHAAPKEPKDPQEQRAG